MAGWRRIMSPWALEWETNFMHPGMALSAR
jgi:hypothetical protein